MKVLLRVLFIAFVTLTAHPFASAQISYYMGARAGLGASSAFRYHERDDIQVVPLVRGDDRRISPNVGVWLEGKPDDLSFSFLFHISYRNRGFRADRIDDAALVLPLYGNYRLYNRVDFLSFDLISRFYASTGEWQPYFAGGLRFCNNLNANSRLGRSVRDVADAQLERDAWQEEMDEYNNALLGAVLQVGIKKEKWFVELEWNPDLTSAADRTIGLYDVKTRFNVINVNLGYTFLAF